MEDLRLKRLMTFVNKSVGAVGVTPERWSSCNTSGMNTFFLCSETERVLEALESYKDFCSPPPSRRMTILDFSTLNDGLIPKTPNFKKYGADGLKKLCKSTLRKRLSMLTCQSQEEAKTGNAHSQNSLYQPLKENREILPASKFESRNPLGPLTKEQVLNRLRKNTNTGSMLGNNGPIKAFPLPSVVSSIGKGKLFEELRKRAASTPTGTDGGQNGREVGSDDFMVTPEVFRHRGKIGGPHITSTPTVLPCNLKFETDLGLGLAPTPIVAPFMDLQEKNIGKARRLTTAPSNPGTPRSSHQNKRESLSNSKTRPALKLVTAANMPSVRRRETFLKNGASNVQQTSKLEVKSLPLKLLPKIKSTLHAKTFPEGKRLPPKAASKITLHARTLPKAVSNERLKLESVRSKMLPSRLAPKIPNVGVKSTNPANSTFNLIHKVPNTNIGTKSVINKSSNSQDAVSKVPNTNIGMKGTINQRSSPRTVVTKVPNSNINSKSTINQPCSPCNVPKVLNTNKGTKSTINQPSSPRNVLSSNIGTKSTINQSSSLRTLAPKVTNPNTVKKTTIINPQIPCTSTAKRESIVGGSRLRYSSSNKENAFGLYPAKKSMIGSGIRPPNFRTSIPAPRNVK